MEKPLLFITLLTLGCVNQVVSLSNPESDSEMVSELQKLLQTRLNILDEDCLNGYLLKFIQNIKEAKCVTGDLANISLHLNWTKLGQQVPLEVYNITLANKHVTKELALNVSSSITPGQYELNVYAPNVLKFSTNITVNQTGAFTIHYNETMGEVSIDFMDTITGQQINILNGTIPITGSGLLENKETQENKTVDNQGTDYNSLGDLGDGSNSTTGNLGLILQQLLNLGSKTNPSTNNSSTGNLVTILQKLLNLGEGSKTNSSSTVNPGDGSSTTSTNSSTFGILSSILQQFLNQGDGSKANSFISGGLSLVLQQLLNQGDGNSTLSGSLNAVLQQLLKKEGDGSKANNSTSTGLNSILQQILNRGGGSNANSSSSGTLNALLQQLLNQGGEGKKTNSSSSGSLNAILQQLLNQGGEGLNTNSSFFGTLNSMLQQLLNQGGDGSNSNSTTSSTSGKLNALLQQLLNQVNNSHVDGSKTNLKNNSTLSGSLISILQQLLNQESGKGSLKNGPNTGNLGALLQQLLTQVLPLLNGVNDDGKNSNISSTTTQGKIAHLNYKILKAEDDTPIEDYTIIIKNLNGTNILKCNSSCAYWNNITSINQVSVAVTAPGYIPHQEELELKCLDEACYIKLIIHLYKERKTKVFIHDNPQFPEQPKSTTAIPIQIITVLPESNQGSPPSTDISPLTDPSNGPKVQVTQIGDDNSEPAVTTIILGEPSTDNPVVTASKNNSDSTTPATNVPQKTSGELGLKINLIWETVAELDIRVYGIPKNKAWDGSFTGMCVTVHKTQNWDKIPEQNFCKNAVLTKFSKKYDGGSSNPEYDGVETIELTRNNRKELENLNYLITVNDDRYSYNTYGYKQPTDFLQARPVVQVLDQNEPLDFITLNEELGPELKKDKSFWAAFCVSFNNGVINVKKINKIISGKVDENSYDKSYWKKLANECD